MVCAGWYLQMSSLTTPLGDRELSVPAGELREILVLPEGLIGCTPKGSGRPSAVGLLWTQPQHGRQHTLCIRAASPPQLQW